MKEITREETIKKVVCYEAVDGKRFSTKEDCEAYEKSAKIVLLKELEPYKKGHMTPYDLFDGEGSEEYDIDIYYMADAEVLHKFNIYRTMVDSHTDLIKDEYIGKTILLFWGYDHDCSYNMGTFEDVVERMRKKYTEAITPKEEEPKTE